MRQRELLGMSAERIYSAMRQRVDWIGLGDPPTIGAMNFNSIIENLPLQRNHAVLDFGCGIGRTSVFLAEFLNEDGCVVGSDIVPSWIRFCQEHFVDSFPNATFHCVKASNPVYDDIIAVDAADANGVLDEDQFFLRYNEAFDVVVAFSVFTHFDPTMAAYYLKSLRGMTRLSGHLFLTWFLDHASNPVDAQLGPKENFRNRYGKLEFAIFSLAAVAELAASAGLLVERVSYGSWRNWPPETSLKGQHDQDIVILRPNLPIEFNANTYLEVHKDVADAGMDPVRHYVAYGRKEGRRLR
jgi:cyclopropane fatty-acyl-phospholipid synthase-like methyltransferase